MSEKYIRIQDAVDALAKTMPTPATPDGAGEFDHEIHIADEAFADAIRIIESLEPADVAPVVRCKECKFRENDDFCTGRGFPYQLVPDDGFCDKGKRDDCTGII